MNKWQRRTVYYALFLVISMLVFSVLYQNGMRIYEGDPRTFLHSLQVVVETFTTTGFGSDSPWTSPEMNVLVIIMDLFGTLVIFLAFPVLAFPLLENALSTTVPKTVDSDLSDHVVICTYTPRADALIDELDSHDVDHVIVEPDRERAMELYEDDYRVIRADPESVSGLEQANLASARALVADVSDQVDASIVLTAQEVTDDVSILSVVEEPDRAAYHRLAGADEVLSPRPLLGQSLASKVTTSITSELAEVEIGDDFEIAEFPIHRGSQLVGTTLAESGIRKETGVNVIGAWFRGDFETPPSPDATLTNGTVLLATGHKTQLEQLKDLTLSGMRQLNRGDTIVVGHGEVGQAVTDALTDAGVPYTVVDQTEIEGVDVVGDASQPTTLREAGISDASAVILALPNDTMAEFATLVTRDLSADVEIIARVEESQSIPKMYQAGADYVLALATVTGRMLASRILEEDILSLDQQVEVVRTSAPELVGETLGEARIRSESGCTVVGIERDGSVTSDIGPDTRIKDGDELILVGTDEGVQRFAELYT